MRQGTGAGFLYAVSAPASSEEEQVRRSSENTHFRDLAAKRHRRPVKSRAKLITQRTNDKILLITGKESGRATWWYIKVSRLKEPLLLKALGAKPIRLADYGEIVRCGPGAMPPQDVVDEIEEEYH